MFNSECRSKKHIYICTTAGLSLWIGINSIKYHIDDGFPTRAELIDILRKFTGPLDIHCKCRNCRYLKLFRRKL